MKKTLFTAICLLLIFSKYAFSQDEFFSIDSIPEIRITFPVKGWKHYMDSVFTATDGEGRCMADVMINGQKISGAGIRYKGFSSVELKDIKNPLNIDLAYTRKNKNYHGFTSLKLSNINYDPSFIREVLSYEIARKYMPASQANFARVYINDTLVGLYSNVESLNKKFLIKHFPSKDNTFIKGKPQTLEYPFGDNANLAMHGLDSLNYTSYYELESDYGWSDLFHFIYILNEESDSLSQILNIDRTLWMHAFNFSLINLDSYIGYSQNYYLYKDDNGQFNPFIWDLNMSFGSFRESDGSTHFMGLTIPQAKVLDPLEHLSFSISPRPLMTKLFQNATFRKMYLAHIRIIMNENFRNGEYYIRGKHIQDVIDQAVQQDTNKFYPYTYFRKNLDTTVGTSGSTDEFPGIKDLMESRLTYLDSYPGINGAPVISSANHIPEYPVRGEPAWITVKTTGASQVMLGYRFHQSGVFTRVRMIDDGNHNDSLAGDGIYGAAIIPAGPTIEYYFWAENDSAGSFFPERAEYEFLRIQPRLQAGDFTINELMIPGQDDPWIEFLNNTAETINPANAFLSDDPSSLKKWNFPDTLVTPHEYLLIKLSAGSSAYNPAGEITLKPSGGQVYLSNQTGQVVDSVIYPEMNGLRSIGRYPNGWGAFTFMNPTPEAMNLTGTVPESGVLLYPNPAKDIIHIELTNRTEPLHIEIFNMCGEQAYNEHFSYSSGGIPVTSKEIDLSRYVQGLYYMRITCNDRVIVKSFIVNK
ncbi:MAG: CotH kinase family protein [Bacteroidota bacterium]|nr:CotH kinase family protein [Bacteroidota bacterium]